MGKIMVASCLLTHSVYRPNYSTDTALLHTVYRIYRSANSQPLCLSPLI